MGQTPTQYLSESTQETLCWLAENPILSKHRTDVAEGYYSFPQGEDVVFYMIGEKGMDIIGIPHKKMDTITYFLPD
jgi:toxin ParE1/3/4